MKRFLTCLLPVLLIAADDTQNEPAGYAGYFSDRHSKYYFHPQYHWAADFSDRDQTVTLEDGSIWRVDPSEFRHIEKWKHNDPITVNSLTVDHGWIWSSLETTYFLKNYGARPYPVVKATLLVGPKLVGNYSRQIQVIDGVSKTITLTDRTIWELPDFSSCNRWYVGDYVIVVTEEKTGKPILLNYVRNEEAKANLRKWIYGELTN